MTTTTPEPDTAAPNHGRLTWYIIGSIVTAIILSLVWPVGAMHLNIGGEIFLRLLQMVVVPLVMTSVMSGILGLGDVRKIGRPGSHAILYYLSTTVLAVITGLIVVNVIKPGDSMQRALVEDATREGAQAVRQAKESARSGGALITWGAAVAISRTATGSSNDIHIPHGESMLAISIEQVGLATTPASVQPTVWDETRESFVPLGNTLTAGTAADSYVFQVRLPASGKLRLDYSAQVGGGASIVSAKIERGPPTIGDILENLVLMLFTNNLLGSMVEVNLLPIIVFSIVFAGMLTTMGSRSDTIASLVISANDALMSFILLLMKVAPIGIFCLVAARFGRAQVEGQFIELIKIQSKYMATVLSGLAIHALITLPLLLWFFTRRNPFTFMAQMSQAIMTAFSTASSTATLPVTMECAEVRARVSKRSTEFVLPLGATINMDGTALYEAAAAIFIAQAYVATGLDAGFELNTMGQLTIAITATLAAIGAAGIPEAGLVTMLIVLNAVGLPLEMIGLILPVDWLLDRFRTAVNAFGDSVGAAIVDNSFD